MLCDLLQCNIFLFTGASNVCYNRMSISCPVSQLSVCHKGERILPVLIIRPLIAL